MAFSNLWCPTWIFLRCWFRPNELKIMFVFPVVKHCSFFLLPLPCLFWCVDVLYNDFACTATLSLYDIAVLGCVSKFQTFLVYKILRKITGIVTRWNNYDIITCFVTVFFGISWQHCSYDSHKALALQQLVYYWKSESNSKNTWSMLQRHLASQRHTSLAITSMIHMISHGSLG